MTVFTQDSLDLTKRLSPETKKQNGIYFTPTALCTHLTQMCFKHNPHIQNVLEPSCGSGEFLHCVLEFDPHMNIDAVEYNSIIYETLTQNTQFQDTPNLRIFNEDFLTWSNQSQGQNDQPPKYDLIIGNPPYFTLPKNKVSKEDTPYFTGRPNIYVIFIIRCLKRLAPNGILSFVLPLNFLNCTYYNALRQHIHDHYTILDIQTSQTTKFIDTAQEVVCFTVQNSTKNSTKKPTKNSKYVFVSQKQMTFNIPSVVSQLKILVQNSTSLHNLNCQVCVGNFVWNQNKQFLTYDDSNTLLVYSSNIKNNKIQLFTSNKNESKKQYCLTNEYSKAKANTDPVLLFNRGYGKGKYKLSYAYLDLQGKPYFIENHLICIKHAHNDKKVINQIMNSFGDPRTIQFIDLYFSNNAINTSELKYILPIYTSSL